MGTRPLLGEYAHGGRDALKAFIRCIAGGSIPLLSAIWKDALGGQQGGSKPSKPLQDEGSTPYPSAGVRSLPPTQSSGPSCVVG
jgi:hypothetical protein